MLEKVIKNVLDPSLCPDPNDKSMGSILGRDHNRSELRGNTFSCFCVIQLTNQPTSDTGEKTKPPRRQKLSPILYTTFSVFEYKHLTQHCIYSYRHDCNQFSIFPGSCASIDSNRITFASTRECVCERC